MANILLIYANDTQASLQQLEKEAKTINRLLDRVPNKSYSIKMIPAIEATDLIDELAHNGTELQILHYAGHADARAIDVAGQSAQAKNLAKQLQRCANLQLVFLNGCNTMEQVPFFHEAGIPYVIATNALIRDEKASWIASQFYLYLTLGRDISDAFQAVEEDALTLEKDVLLTQHRGIVLRDKKETDLAWCLYAKEEAAPYLLPLKKMTIAASSVVEHGEFLSALLLGLENYSSPLNSKYKEVIEALDFGVITDNSKITALLKILPYPLGIRLRQISAKGMTADNEAEYYRELLLDYACFFETLMQFTFSLMVSQLWQNKKDINEAASGQFDQLKTFICSNRLDGAVADYQQAIQDAAQVLAVAGIENPVTPTSHLFTYLDSADFQEACSFFDMQKEYFWQKILLRPKEATSYCYKAQKLLATAFQHFGFVIENVMTSIRYINVVNFRHVEAAYVNEVWQLLASEDGTIMPRRFDQPLENKSVLCFKDEKLLTETSTLNLFPFFIDRSAFSRQSGKVVDLYQFVGYFQDDWIAEQSKQAVQHPNYYYMSLRNPQKIWRFDTTNLSQAHLFHIDDTIPEGNIAAHMKVTVAKELKDYFQQFENFLKM